MNSLPAVAQIVSLIALIVGGVSAFGGGLAYWASKQSKAREQHHRGKPATH